MYFSALETRWHEIPWNMYSNISVKDNKQKRQSINILLIDTVKLQLNNRHPKRSECVLNEKLTINNGRSLFNVPRI